MKKLQKLTFTNIGSNFDGDKCQNIFVNDK